MAMGKGILHDVTGYLLDDVYELITDLSCVEIVVTGPPGGSGRKGPLRVLCVQMGEGKKVSLICAHDQSRIMP